MSLAVTVPDTLEMMVGEKLDLSVDFTGVTAAGDVCSSPVVTMTNLNTNETISSSVISPSFSGIFLLVRIDATNLRKKNSYMCLFTATATNGGQSKTVSAQLVIKIIF